MLSESSFQVTFTFSIMLSVSFLQQSTSALLFSALLRFFIPISSSTGTSLTALTAFIKFPSTSTGPNVEVFKVAVASPFMARPHFEFELFVEEVRTAVVCSFFNLVSSVTDGESALSMTAFKLFSSLPLFGFLVVTFAVTNLFFFIHSCSILSTANFNITSNPLFIGVMT
uniref:Uncharacterized protein n=1 Tax=Panstrongylus lignarius TaxID=156445 RepID=A0A224XM96_9HEMI